MSNEQNLPADAGPLEREVKPLVKWRTGWRHEIERVECTKETAKCVWHLEDYFGKKRESRRDKMGQGWQYHDSWEDAHAYSLIGTREGYVRPLMDLFRQRERA